ncbi:MAG TPA: ATP-binding protein [Longimicrobiales bacterium]|nr:ATP-binding protein [Longimicrobiales bacterium]
MGIGIQIVIGVMLALAGFAFGRAMGRSGGVAVGRRVGRDEGFEAGRVEARAEAERQMRTLVEAVSRGRRPQGVAAGSVAAELQRALEQGWAPRDAERQAALVEAVGRVSAFLRNAVGAPLAGAAPSADAEELRERIERALGAVKDLDFFTKEPVLDTETKDLSHLVQQVTREFAHDQGVAVRLSLDDKPVRARVNVTSLMDAFYLVLHNAARFGGAATVDVTVLVEGGEARIRVRDRGPGFSEEALRRAFDPFYSTAEDGLGLGLPHARRVVEGMGGRIALGNGLAGGGEVEIAFPAA